MAVQHQAVQTERTGACTDLETAAEALASEQTARVSTPAWSMRYSLCHAGLSVSYSLHLLQTTLQQMYREVACELAGAKCDLVAPRLTWSG